MKAGFYKGRCSYCGVKLRKKERGEPQKATSPSRDHETPKSRVGAGAADNLRLCCAWCNWLKARLTVEEYRAYLRHVKPTWDGVFHFELGEGASYKLPFAPASSVWGIAHREWRRAVLSDPRSPTLHL